MEKYKHRRQYDKDFNEKHSGSWWKVLDISIIGYYHYRHLIGY